MLIDFVHLRPWVYIASGAAVSLHLAALDRLARKRARDVVVSVPGLSLAVVRFGWVLSWLSCCTEKLAGTTA